MSEEYFGYTTGTNESLTESRRMAARMGEDIRHYPDQPSSGEYVEPTVDYESDRFQDQPVEEQNAQFLDDTVERIYKRIMAQDSGPIYQLSDQWWNVVQVIDDLSGRVLKAANGLKYGGDGSDTSGKGWSGAGADAFLMRGPGATLKSLDDWRSAAVVNWLGSMSLAQEINTYQSQMSALWTEYKEAMVQLSDDWLAGHTMNGTASEIRGTTLGDQYAEYMRTSSWQWSERAQKIQSDMAKAYWSVMSEDLAGGTSTVYEGPTDAVQPNMDFIARWQMRQFGVPGVTKPNIGTPNITKPTVDANALRQQMQQLNNVDPDITPPSAEELAPPQIDKPNTEITTPTLPPPPVLPPMVPPPVPRNGLPNPAQTLPRATPPTAPSGQGLLRNMPSGGSGLLRSSALTTPTGEGLPPSAPQSRTPQAPPPPAIKGRGTSGPPSAMPPGKRGGGPGESTPESPSAPGTPARTNQFGGPPGNPASPILRNPRSTPAAPGSGPRRGAAAGPFRERRGGSGQPDGTAALRSDAAPPVLNRPRQAAPPPLLPPARPPVRPGTPANPLAPPSAPTASPVVGRSAPAAPTGPAQPEAPTGVVRSVRNAAAAYEGQIGSRRMEQDARIARIDKEFEEIRHLLDREEAWTVATPGGGVVDAGPGRPATQAEPKPTLGA